MSPADRSKTILVSGDAAIDTGPFRFLTSLVCSLHKNYRFIFYFCSKEFSPSLKVFCRQQGIPLLHRPRTHDLLDAFLFQVVALQTHASFVVINAPSFAKNLQLLVSSVPTIYYSHSIWHGAISRKEAGTLSALLDATHKVVTVSRAAFISLQDNYFRIPRMKASLTWLHNWVPDRASRSAEASSRRKRKIVLTVGTIDWYKNPLLWVRVARRVLARPENDGSIKFWWAGRGALLNQALQLSEHDPRIRFLGFKTDPNDLYAQASVYFQPSQFESFGLAICEAMMFGLPCVVTDCGGPRELVEDGITGFVIDQEKEDLMVEKIALLLLNSELRSKMGALSRQRYLKILRNRNGQPNSARSFKTLRAERRG